MGSSDFRVGWVEIQSSTMEIDRGLEMLDIPEAAGRFRDPLNNDVEDVHCRMGDAGAPGGDTKSAWRLPPSGTRPGVATRTSGRTPGPHCHRGSPRPGGFPHIHRGRLNVVTLFR